MDGYVIGLVVGIAAGIPIGMSIAKKQKSWSDQSKSERKWYVSIIAGLSILVVVGLVFYLLKT